MKTSMSVIIIFSLILLISCQPKTIVKNEDTAMIDSSFYYIQKDINDPFLDTVFQAPDQPVSLKKEIYPPPPPVQKFKEIEGYRIQIFAGLDTLNALSSYARAKSIVTDSIYMFKDKGLLKVQVGDYPYRYQADKVRDKFRKNEFPGAWVILRTILIPINGSAMTDSIQTKDTLAVKQISDKPIAGGKYKIQIIATGSETRAAEIVNELKLQLNSPAFFEPGGNLFKVFVGYFNDEKTAREMLDKVRNSGYPDAWLVY